MIILPFACFVLFFTVIIIIIIFLMMTLQTLRRGYNMIRRNAVESLHLCNCF